MLTATIKQTKPIGIIGTMSGTSMDGVDVAYILVDQECNVLEVKDGYFLAYKNDDNFKSRLQNIASGNPVAIDEILHIEDKVTDVHIQAIKEYIAQANLQPQHIDIVGFHGQTVYHNSTNKTTLQLGNPHKLKAAFNTKVCYDFRRNDMSLGGEGAPIAPIYHAEIARQKISNRDSSGAASRTASHQAPHSASELSYPIVFVNIGGVSNATYIETPGAAPVACDVGTGCALIDDTMLASFGVPFDKSGQTAKLARINEAALLKLSQDSFFSIKPPKSLDRNHFKSIVDAIRFNSTQEKVATLTAFSAYGIVNFCNNTPTPPKTIVFSGGGRHNETLIANVKANVKAHVNSTPHGTLQSTNAHNINKEAQTNFLLMEELGLSGDYIEAQMIAYISARTHFSLSSTFKTTTGCHKNSICGVII